MPFHISPGTLNKLDVHRPGSCNHCGQAPRCHDMQTGRCLFNPGTQYSSEAFTTWGWLVTCVGVSYSGTADPADL